MHAVLELSRGHETASLHEILAVPGTLRTVFQPIATRRRGFLRIHAVEALTRGPAGSAFSDAGSLFGIAGELGLESELDRASIVAALTAVQRRRLSHDIFVNVSPLTLMRDGHFAAFLLRTSARHDIDPTRLVLEITEHGRWGENGTMMDTLRVLTEAGVAIGMDDFGGGEPDTELLRLWAPHWVKIDGGVIRRARESDAARELIAQVVRDGHRAGRFVVAEGLEQQLDIHRVEEHGVKFLQGRGICREVDAADVASAFERMTALQRPRAVPAEQIHAAS